LDQAPPSGIIADVRVVVQTEDDVSTFNHVRGFKVVANAPPPGTLDPDDEEEHSGEVHITNNRPGTGEVAI
jgi:hypothetical protein